MLVMNKWHGFKVPDFAIFVYIFFLINAVNVLSFNNMSCGVGKWGGFLSEKCSGGEFCDYLYALSLRANRTGRIFLNSVENREWFSRMKTGCEVENLMAGNGGCSDFSTVDVHVELGHELEKMNDECGTKRAYEPDESCLRTWEEIKEMEYEDGESMELDTQICSFAVLVTLISRDIGNEMWAWKLFDCLGNEQIRSNSEVAERTEKNKIGPGFFVLIGGMGVLAVVIFSVLIFSRKRETPVAPVEKYAWKPALLPNCPSWKPALSEPLHNSSILKLSIGEVYAATDNLHVSNFVGEGTAGRVYRGVLSGDHHVAIKQITDDTFLREIRSLVHVKHPNLVALVGYCENATESFLIYELCPKGSLFDWLYGEGKALTWLQRLDIATGSARGLRFLHTFHEGCIVHRDVKPTNILLGTNFEAKLSDFGLSKVMDVGESSVSSEVRGTFGYIDPDYQTNHHISAASDIYSFGVVLFQILSGRKVIDMDMKTPKPLDKIAKSVMEAGKMVEFADTNLQREYPMDAYLLVFELALSCTGQKRKRPSITQVVLKLEEAQSISMRNKESTDQIAQIR